MNRQSPPPKAKPDPRRAPRDEPEELQLVRELQKLGPRKPPKRVVPR